MNREIDEYNIQLQRGDIQKAYRSIIGFMAKFRIYLKRKYPSHIISALYPGYMDMTYFSITPENLKKHNLKIAIVYLHEPNAFEVWLSGVNRSVQAEYIKRLLNRKLNYRLSMIKPGVDSIVEHRIKTKPDFDRCQVMMSAIESEYLDFEHHVDSVLAK